MPVDAVDQRNHIGHFERRTRHYHLQKNTQQKLKAISESQSHKPPQKINSVAALYFSTAILLNLVKTVNTPVTLPTQSPLTQKNTLFNGLKSAVTFASHRMAEVNNALHHIDFLKFPVASAEPTKSIKQTSTRSSDHNDAIIEKLDYECVNKRENLSISKIIRKMGETISNPILEMTRESQILYFYNKYGRCPREDESEILLSTSQAIDLIISYFLSTTSEAKSLAIIQNALGRLLTFFADRLDNIDISENSIADFEEQVMFITKSIIDTSLRNERGERIEHPLKVPNHLYLKNRKPHIKMNNEELETLIIDHDFFVKTEDGIHKVYYRDEKWLFSDEEAPSSYTAHEEKGVSIIDENSLIDLDNEDVDILCGTRRKRGAGLRKMCNLRTTGDEDRHYSEASNEYSHGSIGTVYTLDDDYVIKKYQTKIDTEHTSRLKYAINTAKAFSRIYGKGTAKVSITPEPDGHGTATVYVKMLKIPGTSLNEIAKSSDPETLFNLLVDLQSKNAINNLLRKLKEAGIKHNDINISNIMYDKEYGLNIIDFDSATFLPAGETIPEPAMKEMQVKAQHALRETERTIQQNTNIEALLINVYGDKIKTQSTSNSITYRIGKFTIKEFTKTGDMTKSINHEIGACNHVMSKYQKKHLKIMRNKNSVIYNHIEGSQPTEHEVRNVLISLFKQKIIFANPKESYFIKTPEGDIIPTDFNMVFSRNRIEKLHIRLKKRIIINYVKQGYRHIPHEIRPMYNDIISQIDRSLGEQQPSRYMSPSLLKRAGFHPTRKKNTLHGNTL